MIVKLCHGCCNEVWWDRAVSCIKPSLYVGKQPLMVCPVASTGIRIRREATLFLDILVQQRIQHFLLMFEVLLEDGKQRMQGFLASTLHKKIVGCRAILMLFIHPM